MRLLADDARSLGEATDFRLEGSPDTATACTHMDAKSVPCGLYARLSARPAAEQADEIQPPCMTPLVYAAGSREHRSYLLIDYLSAAPSWRFNTPGAPCWRLRRAQGLHRTASALKRL